jgi:tight adherence protein B
VTGVAVALLGAGAAVWPDYDRVRLRLDWLRANRVLSATDNESTLGSAVAETAAPPGGRVRSWRIRVAICTAVSVVVAGQIVLGVVPAVLLGLAAIVLGRLWLGLRKDRDRDRGRIELAVAVSALADECSAGASLAIALQAASSSAGRYGRDFAVASAAVLKGAELAEVWQPVPELSDLAAACSLASATGAQLTTVLSVVGNDLEADNSLRAAVAGILAGPLSSAGLLAMLPVVGVVLGMAMGAHPQTILLHTAWGLAVLAVGIGFDLAGVAWTVAIAARASP